MTRKLLLFPALLALAACGLEPASQAPQSAAAPSVAGVGLDTLTRHVVAIGEGWRLDSDPQAGLTLDLANSGELISADYAAPTRTNEGATRITSGRLALTLDARACTHGGASYPMTASVVVEGQAARTGCAYMRWDERLTELLPAVDACLSLAPAGSIVTYAAQEAQDRVLVRIRSGETASDCRAPRAVSSGPAVTIARDAALVAPGEGDPLFVRARDGVTQPGGECYEAPAVRGPDGAVLGWLAADEAC